VEQPDSVVYFVQNEQGYTKIGCTANLTQRMADLGKLWGDLEIVHTVPGSFDLEKRYHWALVSKRIYGEWFDLEPVEIDAIKGGWEPPEPETDKFLPRVECPDELDAPSVKTMHINLYDERVEDYQVVKDFYGIENDNDLVRYLFSTEAKRIRGTFPLFGAAQLDAQAKGA